jgi:hypothetical protein
MEDYMKTKTAGKMTEKEFLKLKPSALIKVAVADLIAVEKMKKKYTVDMNIWHDVSIEEDGTCHVCLAGSVMACTLGVDASRDIEPSQLSDKLEDRLNAINRFREGYIADGLHSMGRENVTEFEDIGVVDYHDNPHVFKKQMLGIAAMLEVFNL